jgi:hypothetical protein
MRIKTHHLHLCAILFAKRAFIAIYERVKYIQSDRTLLLWGKRIGELL